MGMFRGADLTSASAMPSHPSGDGFLNAPPSNGGSGAGDVIRTRDIFLGKEVLYQLSYTRI